MQSLDRRAFLALLALSGCLTREPTPPVANESGELETPVSTPPTAPSTPPVATEPTVERRIEPARLVTYEAAGFSFVHPANWQERSAADGAIVSFEYETPDGRVLGTLRAWGSLNTAYDDVAAAESETVRRLSQADHAVRSTRAVTLPDDRPGRVVEYTLADTPVRGATVVTLAGPWVLRLVVLVHEDVYTDPVRETVADVLGSLTYTG
ncbi:hypothetical protein [Salinigranum halophilum]|uniref:hypothetical protein n=1 Tax=Salinigranum halophilum TaxID=2565931 RepID=UPI0010A7A71B|nr:hypothetical protein [Salinigranum halophilum]